MPQTGVAGTSASAEKKPSAGERQLELTERHGVHGRGTWREPVLDEDPAHLGHRLIESGRASDAVWSVVGEDEAERGLAGVVAGDAYAARGGGVAGSEGGVVEVNGVWVVVRELRVDGAAVLAEDALDANSGAARHVGDLGLGWRGQWVKDQRARCVVAHVDAIEPEHMEVHVEPERAVCSMHSRDGSGVRVSDTGEAEQAFGAAPQRARELTHERTHHLGAEHAVVAEQRAQAPGQ